MMILTPLTYKSVKLLAMLICLAQFCAGQTPAMPFPQHTVYTKGAVRPSQYSQNQLDQQVITFYKQWKSAYLKPGCNTGEYYVEFGKKDKQCVSEGQGYGMLITVCMAGFDPDARRLFDGLYQYYHSHPAKSSPYLMAWEQDQHCKSIDRGTASDGDLDIADALLMADKQWGSKGSINYKLAARQIIDAIMRHEINPKTFTVLLGDAIEYDSPDYYDTRTSDFMPGHFRSFYHATHDVRWTRALNNSYQLFDRMQRGYSPDAGLVPDFIKGVNKNPRPVKPNYLESPWDGKYYYNACRVPWRIATDYLLYGDARGKVFCQRINNWVKLTTGGKPDNLSAGYSLEGNDLKNHYFEALSFIGPFAVSATVDSKNQRWLNGVWDYLLGFKLKDYDYYDNTVKLLCMLTISGNYWRP